MFRLLLTRMYPPISIRLEETNISWIRMIAINILKNGPLPGHVGIMPDGSRRYARTNGLSRFDVQHRGFYLIMDVYQWCFALGIPIVTVYLHSFNNLRRSEEEVQDHWVILAKTFEHFFEQRDLLKNLRVRVRIFGELNNVPKHLRQIMAKIMIATRENNKRTLNIAFAYTSKHEVTRAVKDILKGVEEEEIRLDDISEELISECLYTRDLPEPDLIIRTSGESRLSEFLLWQTTSSCLYFCKALWPAFSIWNLMAAVFYYQRCYPDLKAMRQTRQSLISNHNNSRVSHFLDELDKRRELQVEKLIFGLEVNNV